MADYGLYPLRCGILCPSRILPKTELIRHMVSYIYLYKVVQLKFKLKRIEPAVAWPHHLIYHPTSSVHHQERFVQAVFADFGMWWYAYYLTRPAFTKKRLDVSSSTRITTYQNLPIQLVQNAPDDGPMRSGTCRAKLKCWLRLTH